DTFLRYWHEVAFSNVKLDCSSQKDSSASSEKWYPCQKGGSYRKWFGNNEYVVNWQYDGRDLKNFKPKSVIRNPQYYFR
ncbi:BREX-1 system adenine-specific DNA-methyltransferase PglX, partial [Escherichia coli]|nr:BREX-1 system adenine-specific DNA-methyltransferase PglX [Escherichia coli]